QFEEQRSPSDTRSGPSRESTQAVRQPVIRAAAENLVTGYDGSKFYIWTLDKGTVVWSSLRETTPPVVSPPASQPGPSKGGSYYSQSPPPSAALRTPKVVPSATSYGYGTSPVSVGFSPDGHYFGFITDAGAAQFFSIKDQQRLE